MRPVWTNEVIGDVDGDFDPLYDIVHNGAVLMQNAKLKLKNPIVTAGTRHSAANMNNLFDIDNMDSMKGNTRTTTFNTNGSITEEIRDSVTNVLNARRLTTFPASGNVVETTTIYADDGKSVVRVTTVTTSFPTNTTMKEVVS